VYPILDLLEKLGATGALQTDIYTAAFTSSPTSRQLLLSNKSYNMLSSKLLAVLTPLLLLVKTASGALVSVQNWGSNPTGLQMSIYVPNKLAAKPAVIFAVSFMYSGRYEIKTDRFSCTHVVVAASNTTKPPNILRSLIRVAFLSSILDSRWWW
jgi:hypothetical protein